MRKSLLFVGLAAALFVAGTLLPSDSNAFFGMFGKSGGTSCYSGYSGTGCGWTGWNGCGYPGAWGYGWGKGWSKGKKMKAKGTPKAKGAK